MGGRRSRCQWQEICAAHAASGLTARQFAVLAGVNRHTLNWWRWTFRRGERAEVPGGGGFVEVVEAVGGARARVVLRVGGAALEFEALPPAAWVAELVSRC